MTLDYLRLSGRDAGQVALVDAYARAQGMFGAPADDPVYADVVEFDIGCVEPSIAGPKRPQDRVPLGQAAPAFTRALDTLLPGATVRPGRRRGRPRPRRGGRGGHHQLHQHVEPQRDDRGRPARAEGGGAGAEAQAVGQDQPRPGVDGGHRVPRGGGPAGPAGRARLQPRRLRLHHLHRQQRAAARGHLGRGALARPRGDVGAQRQPQLRGPRAAAGAGELPGVAAPRRRLRAGRLDDRRPDDRPPRAGRGRQRRPPRATSGPRRPRSRPR